MIRRFTRNGRDAALAAAVARALEPRFEAMDAKWEGQFLDLRNEICGSRERSVDVREHVARLQEHVDARLTEFDARLNQMGKEIAEQFNEKFAALSATVVHGFDRPNPP